MQLLWIEDLALGRRFYHRFFRFFCSLKLTAAILTLLAIGALVGMFWDQTLSLDQHLAGIEKTGPMLTLFSFFELNDVFHSWWFGSLVLLLALNLIACSIDRLPRIWIDVQNPPKELSDEQIDRLPNCHRVAVPASAAKKLMDDFAAPNSHRFERGQSQYLFFEKQRYSRFGVYVVHLALLMIMFGSIAATNLGVDGQMTIPEGDGERYLSAKGPGGLNFNQDLGFEVRCKDFRLKTFADGSPMDFESDLAIFDPPTAPEPVISKTIRVNDPLQYKGYTFYQASYQPLPGEDYIRLALAPHGGQPQPHLLRIGQSLQLSDNTIVVPVEVSDDYGGLGAALRVQLMRDDEVDSFIVFRQYPDFDPLVRRGKWDVYFQGFDQHYATGVSVGRVPFVSVVFVGFVLLFVGLYMAFCMSHRRYYARLRPLDGELYELTIGGNARRHQAAFADEFQRIVDRTGSDLAG